MTASLQRALGWSLTLHAAVLIDVPRASSVAFDVERAPSSVELVLVQAKAATAALPEPPPHPAVPSPAPQPVDAADPVTAITPSERGALSEVLPAYLRNPSPVYPRSARERSQEGTVVVAVDVLPSGRAGRVHVARSSGHAALDDAAVTAIRQWVFRPGSRLGQPIALWVEIPVTFRLIE